MADQQQVEILKQGIEIWNRWRENNPDVKIDLSKADLRETNLSGANLSRADLSEANLIRANLSGATLAGSSLNGASLSHATLGGTNLSEANLQKAILVEANLKFANLTRTDFTDSMLALTILQNNDLSSSLGLETTRHFGISILGTGTIRQSKGQIPIKFLRGCGLSDLDIEYAKLAAPGLDPEQVAKITYEIHRLYCEQPIQFYSCFISHSSKDHNFAQRLHDDLQNNGVRCYFAPEVRWIGFFRVEKGVS